MVVYPSAITPEGMDGTEHTNKPQLRKMSSFSLYTAKRGKIEQRVEFHGGKVKENQTQEST